MPSALLVVASAGVEPAGTTGDEPAVDGVGGGPFGNNGDPPLPFGSGAVAAA